MTILYEDDYLICDDDAIIIHWYYFPLGSKRIPYHKIKKVEIQALDFFSGKGRIWGGTWLYWLNLDPKRPWKDKLIVIDEGELTKPVITPDRPDEVWDILKTKTQNFP